MLEDGSFVRLYPIDYRYRSYDQWYKKYQWIEVEVEKHDPRKDARKESYRPTGTIRVLGSPLDTRNAWEARRNVVLKQCPTSIEALRDAQEADNTRLGLVRPKSVHDLVIESDRQDWKPKWKADMQQLRLFGPDRKPLQKLPYKFSYRFSCDDPRCKGRHKMMIQDWEVDRLYWGELARLGDREKAAQSVRAKFFDEMCSPAKDVHFFVGTVLKYGTWIVLGVFWPPRTPLTLF